MNFSNHFKKTVLHYSVGIASTCIFFIFYPNIINQGLVKTVRDFFLLPGPAILADLFFGCVFIVSISFLIVKVLNRTKYSYNLFRDAFLPLFLLTSYIPMRQQLFETQNWHFTIFSFSKQIVAAILLFMAISK